MKQQTYDNLIDTLKQVLNGTAEVTKSLKERVARFKKNANHNNPSFEEAMSLYAQVKELNKRLAEAQETDDKAEIAINRDDDEKIVSYSYKIYKKNKNPLVGSLDREEMEIIYRLYSWYGASLTQRQVSRYFPELSLLDFKRILRAFNITKANSCFAPHVLEEHSEDELREMQIREKENNILKHAEEDNIRNNERLLKKYIIENNNLKSKITDLENFTFKIPEVKEQISIKPTTDSTGNSLMLHLADFHIGSYVESGGVYKENLDYDENEVKRRLNVILCNIADFRTKFDVIVINLLGDMIDSNGLCNQTARQDHYMPENMDCFKQCQVYINVMTYFVSQLYEFTSMIRIYSVREGNHTGLIEYMTNKALLTGLQLKFGNHIETTLFTEYFGYYREFGKSWVILHGKDAKFQKKGYPLNLDDKSKVMLYEWLDSNGIYEDDVHIIKGDLHSNNLNSCKRFSYRNVLSLYGASDYSNYNFSRNSYGISYEFINNGQILSGTFENI